jgi:UDP-N-acetylmuramate dehydrogenase
VRDGGYDGTAIFTHGALKEMRREDDGRFYAEAGVASPKLARFVANAGCAEAEFLAGIPGTVGGALAMNAGCHGGETWRYVDQVLMLNRQGERILRGAEDFAFGYRHVGLKAATDEIFAAAWFRFPPGDPEAARGTHARTAGAARRYPAAGIAQRRLGVPQSARRSRRAPDRGGGSQGRTIGGAQVSEKHSNFIVNPEGDASASAIEMLIGRVQAEVREKFGISLLREVRIVGVAGQGGEGS